MKTVSTFFCDNNHHYLIIIIIIIIIIKVIYMCFTLKLKAPINHHYSLIWWCNTVVCIYIIYFQKFPSKLVLFIQLIFSITHLNRGPLALLLWRQHKFPYGINKVKFSISFFFQFVLIVQLTFSIIYLY